MRYEKALEFLTISAYEQDVKVTLREVAPFRWTSNVALYGLL
jgi:hypothetical protein